MKYGEESLKFLCGHSPWGWGGLVVNLQLEDGYLDHDGSFWTMEVAFALVVGLSLSKVTFALVKLFLLEPKRGVSTMLSQQGTRCMT
jgi:hypothetical protein